MTVVIHIHEDDWGMRSMHPVAAWAEASADVARAAAAAQRNRAPTGIGWTAIHVITEPASDFTATGLTIDRAAALVEPLLPRVKRFYATAMAGFDASRRDPYGSYDDEAWAFGYDARCFIKIEPSSDLVSRVWFEATTDNAAHLSALRHALVAIDAITPCIIVDYWTDEAGHVRDALFMAHYFDGLAGTG